MDSKIPQIDIPRLQMREILSGRWRCCWNCDNWREHDNSTGVPSPICTLYKERPPTEVIIVGCPEWFASGIPF
jgi:hypothetical protein